MTAAEGPAERARRRAAALPGSDALARLAAWTEGWPAARVMAAVDSALWAAIGLQAQADAGAPPEAGAVQSGWRLAGWLDLPPEGAPGPARTMAQPPARPGSDSRPAAPQRLWALRPAAHPDADGGPVLLVCAGGPGGPELWDRRAVRFLAEELRRDAAAAERFAALAEAGPPAADASR